MSSTEADDDHGLHRHKEAGNASFKAGHYSHAIDSYRSALSSISLSREDRAILLKNCAACYLKLERYAEAEKAASDSLELAPGDTKAMFRRLLALEQLGREDLAFKEAKLLFHREPDDKAVRVAIERLSRRAHEKAKQYETTDNKAQLMLKLLLASDTDVEKRRQVRNVKKNVLCIKCDSFARFLTGCEQCHCAGQ